MFKESENGEFEINIVRTEEALKTNANVIATSCPFCNTMMTDGVKNIDEGKADVMDLAELIAECLQILTHYPTTQEFGYMALKKNYQTYSK